MEVKTVNIIQAVKYGILIVFYYIGIIIVKTIKATLRALDRGLGMAR